MSEHVSGHRSAAEERSETGVAAFDFDGTITRRDTLMPFLRELCGGAVVARAVLAAIGTALVEGVDRDRLKAAVLGRLLAGRPIEQVDALVPPFAERVVSSGLRDDTLERVAWHRQQGHALVVISASPELYVGPIARRLGFDAALATRLEVGADGRLSGALVGDNVRGPEKVRRLRQHLDQGRGAVRLWAYGNSRGDAELLAAADVATTVTRRGLVRIHG
ncbi:MAG: HAD-IB family hydrolase [Acidimicrobiales bacterium]